MDNLIAAIDHRISVLEPALSSCLNNTGDHAASPTRRNTGGLFKRASCSNPSEPQKKKIRQGSALEEKTQKRRVRENGATKPEDESKASTAARKVTLLGTHLTKPEQASTLCNSILI